MRTAIQIDRCRRRQAETLRDLIPLQALLVAKLSTAAARSIVSCLWRDPVEPAGCLQKVEKLIDVQCPGRYVAARVARASVWPAQRFA